MGGNNLKRRLGERMRGLAVLALAVCCFPSLPVAAQPAAAAPAATVQALMLSDIHLDPFHDPAKAARLNAAPVSEWAAILGGTDAPTQAQDYAALQAACAGHGTDTPNALWRSGLGAIRGRAGHVRFATVSGDLLAHQFDCRYKTLLPGASHADFVSFVEKTIGYIAAGLREALPGVPVYLAMGNDDSGCTDYALDPAHDQFLGLTAKIIGETLPRDMGLPERETALRDFSSDGSYSVPLVGVPRTRLIVLDDVFLSAGYITCSGKRDPAAGTAELAWLQTQLDAARQRHERVWVLGHIPPGVNFYASARTLLNACGAAKPQMFLGSERLAEILAANADIVRLALFGHTHSDEMHLLRSAETGDASGTNSGGVPMKTVASITPINGNRPTFTLATIDPGSATLVDYTVVMASNLTGVGATWESEYTYSSAYSEPAFDAAALTSLVSGFEADPGAKTAASQAYLRNYFPGDLSSVIKFAWPQYACSMNHDSAQSFAACACAATK